MAAVSGTDIVRMAGTLAIGAAGGALAKLVGLPLPWLLGSQLALCVACLSNLRIAGGPPQWPEGSRLVFLPVIGVAIGSTFTWEIVGQIPGWWPFILFVTLFLVSAHALVFLVFRLGGGLDLPTAFFASFPGGFVEATLLGREEGGVEMVIIVQHFLRISLIVLVVPLVFFFLSGGPVGSSVGASLGSPAPISVVSASILLAAGVLGTLLARAIRLPAPDISGAVFASALVHLLGWIDGSVPFWLIEVTQLVVGTSLGIGFAGLTLGQLGRNLGLALAAFATVFTLAVSFAFLLSGGMGQPMPTIALALAPGGLAEMSLIAVSLGLSAPLITLAHLYRICFAVLVLPQAYRLIKRLSVRR